MIVSLTATHTEHGTVNSEMVHHKGGRTPGWIGIRSEYMLMQKWLTHHLH